MDHSGPSGTTKLPCDWQTRISIDPSASLDLSRRGGRLLSFVGRGDPEVNIGAVATGRLLEGMYLSGLNMEAENSELLTRRDSKEQMSRPDTPLDISKQVDLSK